MKLVAIGEITHDYYRDLGRSFVGGISLNFAVQASRCGATAALISRVGGDEAGRLTLEKLAQEEVDARHVPQLPGRTATIDVAFRPDGDRYFPEGSYHHNVLEGFQLSAVELAFVAEHDAYMTLYGSGAFRQSFKQLNELPFTGWRAADFGDVGDRGYAREELLAAMARLDIAFVSGPPTAMIWLGAVAAEETVLVLTSGAAGSCARCGSEIWWQPALPVPNIVDPTGCGDAFQAAFFVNYWQNRDVPAALRAGAEQAAAVLVHYGAT